MASAIDEAIVEFANRIRNQVEVMHCLSVLRCLQSWGT